ncbi:peptidyl-prolyl cis-trans isomerase CYP23 isoform X2 [Euphorbia lathyris]|uniref:peptidyl-prolyl cis-trans isomerase CYP23 isoform X2 n=1 Tax=Euphorbia lathyris TaxID=212925 RepID=UPI0033144E5F
MMLGNSMIQVCQLPTSIMFNDFNYAQIDQQLTMWIAGLLWTAFFAVVVSASPEDPELSSTRVVFQTSYGDIEFGFYPSVAPQTVDHIFKLVRLGCYNTNHFFRVDKGFVAQVADVVGGRSAPMNKEQRKEAEKTVIAEFSNVKHVRGILSMGRYSDPNSASSSFSMLLGDAPHLDGQYTIFGKVTKGDDTLKKLEQLPTRREGIFVMPTERITILSAYYYDAQMETCEEERSHLKRRLSASAIEIERQRMKCFP